MNKDHHPTQSIAWLEASGLPHLLRTLGMALHPAKIGIALVGLIATFMLGGMLDWVWPGGGFAVDEIDRFVMARELGQAREPSTGDFGVFHVWREHERRCILGLLGSSIPGAAVAAGTSIGAYMETHSQSGPLRNIVSMGQGVWWMFREHPVYFVLFGVGLLFIWSCCGGAICRIAAVQFARDRKLTMKEGLAFSTDRLINGFALAPCIPLAIAVFIMVLMALGGVFLRIPLLGDVIGGLLFILAIVGGFGIFLLLLGLAIGGGLFWPAVAVEAADAFDAFSRGLSYPLTRAWKAIWYVVVSVLFASVSWVFVNLSTFFALKITRGIVTFGSTWFGLWMRENAAGAKTSKVELLWPLAGPNDLYHAPNWASLTFFEHISAFFVGLYVALVIAAMWSFLASFYFCSTTVIYFLLRRDVDGTDLEDVFLEDDGAGPEDRSSLGTPSAPPVRSSGTSLPVLGVSGVPAVGHSG